MAQGNGGSERRARGPTWEEWAEAASVSNLIGPNVTERDVGGYLVADDFPVRGPTRMECHADVVPLCRSTAGMGTDHPGVGLCAKHGGKSIKGRREAALLAAHALAKKRGVTPWQALLEEVQRTAGAVAWLDWKVGQAPSDEALLDASEGGYAPWVAMRERERDRLARVAKMTMDAGVVSAMVARAEVSGAATVRVLMNTVSALGLTDEQMDLARGLMRRELLAIATEQSATVIDGMTVG